MKGDKVDLKIIDVKYSGVHTKYTRESVGPDLLFPAGPDLLFPLIFLQKSCAPVRGGLRRFPPPTKKGAV